MSKKCSKSQNTKVNNWKWTKKEQNVEYVLVSRQKNYGAPKVKAKKYLEVYFENDGCVLQILSRAAEEVSLQGLRNVLARTS